MANYKTVQHTKGETNRAGQVYISPNANTDDKAKALGIINNWRAAHAYPLQIIYMYLKTHAPDDALVAQRLKRLDSITAKLERFPDMRLSAMQDLGGCRVIVNTIDDVYAFVNQIRKAKWKHRYKKENDYIASPKDDGYRSYHLVYSYHSDRNLKYNGMFIEIQVRTRLQHLWAMAVETMDRIDGDSIKAGKGKVENKEFFRLASDVIRQYENFGYDVEATKQSAEVERLRKYEHTRSIILKLSAVHTTEFVNSEEKLRDESGYYLIVCDSVKYRTIMQFFSEKESSMAIRLYNLFEKTKGAGQDVVLVSTDSINALKDAYPSYFNNIHEFVSLIDKLVK